MICLSNIHSNCELRRDTGSSLWGIPLGLMFVTVLKVEEQVGGSTKKKRGKGNNKIFIQLVT